MPNFTAGRGGTDKGGHYGPRRAGGGRAETATSCFSFCNPLVHKLKDLATG